MAIRNVVRTLAAAAFAAGGISALASDQTVLVDLGSNQSYRGLDVTNPDHNGNYWNSVWSGAYYPNILDTHGLATDIDFGFDAADGTDSYNGPAGPTSEGTLHQDVLNTDIDAAALGSLGGALEGPFDYYTSSRFQIQGLDPGRQYTLTFFGSHKFSTDDRTVYTVYSDASYSVPVATTSLLVQTPGQPWLHNRDQVATLAGLAPQAGNILYVEFHGASGGLGYLNDFQIDVTPEPSAAVLLLAGCLLARAARR